MKKLSALDWISIVLVVIGGLNWGLVGLANFDLVTSLFGAASVLTRIIYVLTALSAIYIIVTSDKFARK